MPLAHRKNRAARRTPHKKLARPVPDPHIHDVSSYNSTSQPCPLPLFSPAPSGVPGFFSPTRSTFRRPSTSYRSNPVPAHRDTLSPALCSSCAAIRRRARRRLWCALGRNRTRLLHTVLFGWRATARATASTSRRSFSPERIPNLLGPFARTF